MKNIRRPPKKIMEDDLNSKAVLLRLFNNKNLKKNGFDTIEIDLVLSKPLDESFDMECPLPEEEMDADGNF